MKKVAGSTAAPPGPRRQGKGRTPSEAGGRNRQVVDSFELNGRRLLQSQNAAPGIAPGLQIGDITPPGAARHADETLFQLRITDDPLNPVALPLPCDHVPMHLRQALQYLWRKGCEVNKVKKALLGQDGARWRDSCAFLLMRIIEVRAVLRAGRGPCAGEGSVAHSDTLALWFGRLLEAGISPTHCALVARGHSDANSLKYMNRTVAAAATCHADLTLLELIFRGASPASTMLNTKEDFYSLYRTDLFGKDEGGTSTQSQKLYGDGYEDLNPVEEAWALGAAHHLADDARLALMRTWCRYLGDFCADRDWPIEASTSAIGLFAGTFLCCLRTPNGGHNDALVEPILQLLMALPEAYAAFLMVLIPALDVHLLPLFVLAAPKYLEALPLRTKKATVANPPSLGHLIATSFQASAVAKNESFLLEAVREATKIGNPAHALAASSSSHPEGHNAHRKASAFWAIPASGHALLHQRPKVAHALAQQEECAAAARVDLEDTFFESMHAAFVGLDEALSAADGTSAAVVIAAIEHLINTYERLTMEDGWTLFCAGDQDVATVDEAIHRFVELLYFWNHRTEENTSALLAWLPEAATAYGSDLGQMLAIAENEAENRAQARLDGHCWLAEVTLDLPHNFCGRGTLQYLVASGFTGSLAPILTTHGGARPQDYVQAYACALISSQRRKNYRDRPAHVRAMQQLEDALPNGDILLPMLILALESADDDAATRLLAIAKRKRFCFDHLRGPALAQLGELVASSPRPRAGQLLDLFRSEAAQAALLAEADAAGDTLYHRAALCRHHGYNLLALLATKKGFRSDQMASLRNAAGFSPLQEAALAGAGAALVVAWQRCRGHGGEEALVDALCMAADAGQWRGIDALLDSACHDEELQGWLTQLPSKWAQLGASPTARAALQERLATVQTAKRGGEAGAESTLHAALDGTRLGEANEAEALAAAGAGIDAAEASLAEAQQDLHAWCQVVPRAPQRSAAPWLQALHAVRRARFGDGVEQALQGLAQAFQQICAQADLASPDQASLRREMDAQAWQLIAWLEAEAYGQYFGRHFAAHRPEVSDEALKQRLICFRKYGSSRFTAGDGVAVFLLREQARAQLPADATAIQRHVFDVEVPLLMGCGYIADPAGGAPRFYSNSGHGRAVFEVGEDGRGRVVALYPLPRKLKACTLPEPLSRSLPAAPARGTRPSAKSYAYGMRPVDAGPRMSA